MPVLMTHLYINNYLLTIGTNIIHQAYNIMVATSVQLAIFNTCSPRPHKLYYYSKKAIGSM